MGLFIGMGYIPIIDKLGHSAETKNMNVTLLFSNQRKKPFFQYCKIFYKEVTGLRILGEWNNFSLILKSFFKNASFIKQKKISFGNICCKQDNWKWTEVKHIIAWTFADYGAFKACTLYKHSEYGFLRFVYQQGMIVMGEIIYCLFKKIWTTHKL